jgi:hypothetical protein
MVHVTPVGVVVPAAGSGAAVIYLQTIYMIATN